jgi:hypothetical protein
MNYTEEQIRKMDYDEKYDLAENPNTPVDVLEILSEDVDWSVRRNVAENPNTPVDVLKELSKDEDEDEDVIRAVAGNPNTPVDVLKELAKDDYWRVRWRVAQNPNSTEQILVSVFETERRQREPRRNVLRSIIANANCPGYLKAVIQTMLEGKE